MANGESTLNGFHGSEKSDNGKGNAATKSALQLSKSMPKSNGYNGLDSGSPISYSQTQQLTILQDTVKLTSIKITRELHEISEEHIEQMNMESFLEYTERQRLTAMPHRGCHWDRVLKWAEFFALQIAGYANAIEDFVPSSQNAAKLMWTCCRSLIELGQENANPLSKTFGVFYELGLSLSLVLRHDNILQANADVRHKVEHAFNDLLTIVRDVGLYYHSTINSLASGNASLDFAGTFGNRIEAFLNRKEGIVDAMWNFQLGHDASLSIQTLRDWLDVQDGSLRTLHKQRILNPDHRSEFTCEWLQRHFLDFSRSQDDTWAIHGAAGCGKTYLYRWLVERLQRPLGRKSYDVLSYALEADVPTETTPLAVARHLSLQLLEHNVGDERLFDALVSAHNMPNSGKDAKLENALWDALRLGLEQTSQKNNVMVVIDGIDEVQGGEGAAKAIIDHLGLLASKDWIQVITFSRNSHLKPSKGKTNLFEIKADYIHEDLRHMTHQALHRFSHYKSQGEHAQETIVENIIHSARGSFLWAFLTTVLLKEEASHDSFMKAIKATKESPKSLDTTIAKLVESIDLSQRENSTLLSSMLVAERPLSAAEVKLILQIDVQKARFIDTDMEIRESVTNDFGHMIILQNGFFRFRHPSIRAYIMSLANGQKLRTLPAIQADFLLRLFTYCKLTIAQSREPCFEGVEKNYVNNLNSTYALLEYVVRYWTTHFSASSFKPKAGTLQLDTDFKNAFPDSIILVLLEWYCWGDDASAFKHHELALKIRKVVLGEKHLCIVQDLIVCGSVQRSVTGEVASAAGFIYQAWHAAQTVLPKRHNFIMVCATNYLSITEKMTFKLRNVTVTQREELLKYSIDAYKHQYGGSHDLVIRCYKLLAQLYTDIHEEVHAEETWREVHEIIVIRFGKGSMEETSISENLTLVLRRGEKKTNVVEYEKGIFDIVAELDVWDSRRIELMLELALSYESHNDLFKAEGCYIELWRRLVERCRHHGHHHGVDIHIRTIEVASRYVEFLVRCKRQEEASNVLLCVWVEYEEYDFESEVLFLRLKFIGELMRSTSLLTVALSVFRKCWSWFTSHGKVEHVKECEVLITTTITEVSSTTSTTTSTSTTTTTETTIKEIFETTLSRNETSVETITTCKSLISFYMKSERWTEAVDVTRKSLFAVWKFIVTGGGTAALPKNFTSGAIEIAISLAVCYHRTDRFHEAEEIYLRIYRACRNSCKVEDERFQNIHSILSKFYEENRHWQSLIKLDQEVLVAYRQNLGAHQSLTIQMLYTLGRLCNEHGHGDAFEYYEEIVKTLNGATTICHEHAFDAMSILCRHYYQAGHWHKLKHTCGILWETWKGQHRGHEKFTADFVATLYLRYRYVLEHHDHCDYSNLLQLTVEYRNACIKVFGVLTVISIKASMELALLYTKSEKHVHQAITIYEEILTTTKTTSTTTTTVITTSVITTIKQRLTSAYIRVCSHETSSTSTTERAIILVRERYESLKVTLGVAHEEVLTLLRELVFLQLKSKKTDSSAVVLRLLSETCVNIIKTEKHGKKLYEAAKAISGIYIRCGMIEQAHAMIAEMRLQIVTGSASSKEMIDFKIGSTGKVPYVFLVTFEQAVKEHASISYSELMADLLVEANLYDSYHQLLKAQSDAEVVLLHAAKLRAFLVAHHRHSQWDILQGQAFEIFLRKWGQHIKGSRETKLLFFVDLMIELGKGDQVVQTGHAACASSVNTVRRFLGQSKSQEAYEVALCALDFIKHQRAYHELHNVPYGFKLSALLAGRDLEQPLSPKIDPTLRKNMVELSRKIIREVLSACRESNVNFIRMKPRELNSLAGLLGQQENYAELEWLLDLLWSSRDVQKSWKPPIIISIGRLFVQSRFLNKKNDKAIRLAEDIVYNLRRTWGSLDPKTLQMEELLSALYTSMGHHREAMGVHENVLRLIAEGDDGDDRTQDTANAEVAKKHIELLRQTHLRLHGWDKDKHVYQNLIHSVLSLPEYQSSPELKGTHLLVEHWNPKDPADDNLGKFFPPESWEFARVDDLDQKGDVIDKEHAVGRRIGKGMKRVTSQWGISELRRDLYASVNGGDHNEKQQGLPTNGHMHNGQQWTKLAA